MRKEKESSPSRRDFLKVGGVGLTSIGLLAFLASCSPSERLKDDVYASNAHFKEIWVSDNMSIHTEDGSPFGGGLGGGGGDMAKEVYDPNEDGIIALPQLDSKVIPSTPESGKRKVTNIYWNLDTNRLRVVYAKA